MRATLLTLLALPALAQAPDPPADKPAIPAGYVPVDRVESVTVYMRDRKFWAGPLRSDLKSGLQEIHTLLVKQFGFGQESFKTGGGRKAGTGIYQDGTRGPAHVIVFDEKGAFEAWGGTRWGENRYDAKYSSVIGVLADEGKPGPDAWAGLWRDMTSVYFHLKMPSGAPVWLREGLAEYFTWGNKKLKPAETQGWGEMRARLGEAREKKTLTPVATLMGTRGVGFTRLHADQAWVLVHLYVTHTNLEFNHLYDSLAQLEAAAVGKPDGVVNDLYRYAAMLATGLVGTEEKLQAAYDDWLSRILEMPERPKKMSTSFGEIMGTILPDAIGRMDEGGVLITDAASGVRHESRRFLGVVHYRAPWPGRIRVLGATEDRHKDRSRLEEQLLDWTTVPPGEKVRVDNKSFPWVGGAAFGVVIVEWEPAEGGSYRTELKFEY